MEKNQLREKIRSLEEEIRKTPYHKGTEHHVGILRAKLAKLREELYFSSKKRGRRDVGVKKEGEATVSLVGPPSVGKSTLINKLTGVFSPVGDYDFTTTKVVPGKMVIKGASIQVFDLPGLIKGAGTGKGGGGQVLAVARVSDLILLVIDPEKVTSLSLILDELERVGFRLNQLPPKIEIKKTSRGGIRIVDPFSSFKKEVVEKVVKEYGIKNGEVVFKEPIADLSLLGDVLSPNRVYLPAVLVINKSDLLGRKEKESLMKRSWPLGLKPILVSAQREENLASLKELIWEKLKLIRVYLKGKGEGKKLLIMKKGATIADLIKKVAPQRLESSLSVRVWGQGVKFKGQLVSLSYYLNEGDVVLLD